MGQAIDTLRELPGLGQVDNSYLLRSTLELAESVEQSIKSITELSIVTEKYIKEMNDRINELASHIQVIEMQLSALEAWRDADETYMLEQNEYM